MRIVSTIKPINNESFYNINKKMDEKKRREISLEKGLPETSSWSDIIKHNCELQRINYIKMYNLSETSSWSDINIHVDNLKREEWALKKKMNKNSSWETINK